jgi:hypothetical protein
MNNIQWEYKVKQIWAISMNPKNLTEELNKFGKLGWELVCITGVNMATFKRIKQ